MGDRIKDFPVPIILNYPDASSTFNQLAKDITIIDFFGTWCVPCRKALPGLSAIQQKYKDKLQVVLISVEEQSKLEKFIGSQPNFQFPLIADSKSNISNQFNPPAYPYTLIVNKNGTIIASPAYEEITDAAIQAWFSNTTQSSSINVVETNTDKNIMEQPFIKLSQDFVYAAKTNDNSTSILSQLNELSDLELQKELNTDDKKMAFWINVYNGYTQLLLKQNPDQYKNRSAFFSAKQIKIAGHTFSLDEVEHGILRRSKVKWSLGYLGKLFPGKLEKKLRVNKLDSRIHFTLNCGAKSCPPIAFYKSDNLNKQLETATKAYLTAEALYDSAKNTVALPAIFGWFRHDFGGKKGMRKLLKEFNIIPAIAKPNIVFKKYDWNLYLDNYKM